ncbi:hypothetical protein [Curtobacterium sp. PhB134]|nr:hypothetical protein [Curtobacterium sp. PhB134]
MGIALTIGTVITAVVAVVAVLALTVVAVQFLRNLRAKRYTEREVARGAVEYHPPAPLTPPETDLDRIVRDAYEGKRPVRKVQR